jgi:hypothetical protein
MGKRYFEGVYEVNNPAHVLENKLSQGEPLNYYAFQDKNRRSERTKPSEATSGFSHQEKPKLSEA